MKFRMTKTKPPITSVDYKDKLCVKLTGSERNKRWVLNNPEHWYSKKYFSFWLKENK